MNLVSVLLIALGLSMDAFAVSICSGAALGQGRLKRALVLGTAFGSFQALMPTAGWLGGLAFTGLIAGFDHWIALALLGFVGGKMVYSALKGGECERVDSLRLGTLLALSVATSIDALAVGLSLAFLKTSILGPVLAIGAVTFGMSFLGVYLGKGFGHLLAGKAELVGGLILVGIGVKIVVEHVAPGVLAHLPLLLRCAMLSSRQPS